MSEIAFLAVDWGTTNRRIYCIDKQAQVLFTERDDRGVLGIAPSDFAGEVAIIRARFGDLPMLCAGMVGSSRGWLNVPYLACPVDLKDLAHKLHWIDSKTAIVPGVSLLANGRADVMRGEEVQLLGSRILANVPDGALLCQPGTHCKWASIIDGAITVFWTTMTGELFAMLRADSLLADYMSGEVVDGPDFDAGIADARHGTLITSLFGARASVLLEQRSGLATASYISGLLIGSDVNEQRLEPGTCVYLVADPPLSELYSAAITAVGARAVRIDSHDAFVAGIIAIERMSHAP